MTLAVRSERQSSIAVLVETTLNVDGDQLISSALPAGFGDCAILGVGGTVAAVATMMTDPTLTGPSFLILSPDVVNADILGTARWRQTGSGSLRAWVDLERPVYMRADETIQSGFLEVDTNAAPTADYSLYVRVRRMRDLSPGERQLYLRGMFGA